MRSMLVNSLQVSIQCIFPGLIFSAEMACELAFPVRALDTRCMPMPTKIVFATEANSTLVACKTTVRHLQGLPTCGLVIHWNLIYAFRSGRPSFTSTSGVYGRSFSRTFSLTLEWHEIVIIGILSFNADRSLPCGFSFATAAICAVCRRSGVVMFVF